MVNRKLKTMEGMDVHILEKKIIGFAGIDVQDTMLYLSRIFYHMGKSVLLADYSKSQALFYSFPQVQGVDAHLAVIKHRGVFFTGRQLQKEELGQYDVIMFFFGFEQSAWEECCAYMVYTTDCNRNHVEMLEMRKKEAGRFAQFVFRNAGEAGIRHAKVKPDADGMKKGCSYAYNDSRKDRKLRMQCQYNTVFGFSGLSLAFRNYLKDTVKAVFPEEASRKEFRIWFQRAEMGA